MSTSVPLVILDTTELRDAPQLHTGLLGLMLNAARIGRIRIAIPIVVRDEFERHQRRALTEAAKKAADSEAIYARIVGRPPKPTFDADNEFILWQERSRVEVTKARIEVLPLPSTPHEHLLKRDLGNRRPFRDNGGYRDALIWETVLAAAATTDRVVFVTNNTKDFANDDKTGLHSDLKQDIADCSMPGDRVHLAVGLKSAVDLLGVIAQPEPVLAAALENGTDAPDIRAWILQRLPMVAGKVDVQRADGHVDQLLLTAVHSIEELRVERAWRLEPGSVHVVMNVVLRVDMKPDAAPYVASALSASTQDGLLTLVHMVGSYFAHQQVTSTLTGVRLQATIETSLGAWNASSNLDIRKARLPDTTLPAPFPKLAPV